MRDDRCPRCAYAAGVAAYLAARNPSAAAAVDPVPQPDPIELERYEDDGGPCGRDF
jgi:hypothetical protein